jgi:hypothetical protein
MHLGACSRDLPVACATLGSSMPTLCASVGEQMKLSVCSYRNMVRNGQATMKSFGLDALIHLILQRLDLSMKVTNCGFQFQDTTVHSCNYALSNECRLVNKFDNLDGRRLPCQ